MSLHKPGDDEREAAKLRYAGGGGGAQRPVLCVNEPKKDDTHDQNQLVN
jgi:hypothetical protein